MRHVLLALPLVIGPALALAQEGARATLTWGADGSLRISQPLTLPDGCHRLEPARPGAPQGQVEIAGAAAVTLPIVSEGEICTQALQEVTASAEIPALPAGTVAVIIYESWPRIGVKATAYALPASEK